MPGWELEESLEKTRGMVWPSLNNSSFRLVLSSFKATFRKLQARFCYWIMSFDRPRQKIQTPSIYIVKHCSSRCWFSQPLNVLERRRPQPLSLLIIVVLDQPTSAASRSRLFASTQLHSLSIFTFRHANPKTRHLAQDSYLRIHIYI